MQWTYHNPSPEWYDYFGSSVAVSANNALVGAAWDDTGAPNAGSAYLFDAGSGALLRSFNNPAPEEEDLFGFSVAISGDNALVGSSDDDTVATDAGSVYLFDAATGSLLHTINNPTPEAVDRFGYSVAVWGNRLLVGAPEDDTGAPSAGSAYLFDATSGALLQSFHNPTPAAGDWFGAAVSISSIYVLVGALWDDTGANDAGSAYLFNGTTGELLQTITNPSPDAGDWFGQSVAVSGVNVLVGSLFDGAGGDRGSVYLFFSQNGALVRTFNSPDSQIRAFGQSISIDGEKFVVGAAVDQLNSHTGLVYLFNALDRSPLRTFTAPDYFGGSVAISGNHILVGASGDDTGAGNAGSAFLFTCAPVTRARVLDYLLGRNSDPAGLDANGDTRIDVADLVATPE